MGNRVLIKARMYGTEVQSELPISVHVHERIDRFDLLNQIDNRVVPIAYVETSILSPKDDLNISNMSHIVPEVYGLIYTDELGLNSFSGSNYIGNFKDYLFTNKSVKNSKGTISPLWFKHVVSKAIDTKKLVNINLIKNVVGHNKTREENYLVDLAAGCIYTDFDNYVDLALQAYTVYTVQATYDDGSVVTDLLRIDSAVQEATWEDMDLTTGILTTAYPTYTKVQLINYWEYTFNIVDTYFVKPNRTSFFDITISELESRSQNWNIQISNADFYMAGADGMLRRYWVPEYYTYNYYPYIPYKQSNRWELKYLSSSYLVADGKQLALDLEDFTIYVYNEYDVLIYVYSTNGSIVGTKYNGIEIQAIIDYQFSSNGIIALNIPLQSKWKFYLEGGVFKNVDYVYTNLDFNPQHNSSILDSVYYFYLIPDCNVSEQAIHYMRVNSDGIIVETSQGWNGTYINLKITDPFGNYNPDTIIGRRFIGSSEAFFNNYLCVGNNDYQYLPIGLVNLKQTPNKVVDLIPYTRPLYSIEGEYWKRNVSAMLTQSGYGLRGLEYPANKVTVVKVPVSLLESYKGQPTGGRFTEQQVQEMLEQFYSADGKIIIDWWWLQTQISASSETEGEVVIRGTFEGPGVYSLYRKTSTTDYSLIDEATIVDSDYEYTDTGLSSGDIYQYAIQIDEHLRTKDYEIEVL